MKSLSTRSTAATALVLALLLAGGCATTPGATTNASGGTTGESPALLSKAPIQSDRVTLHVNGLSCPLCASNVDKQLGVIPGVSDVKVDFDAGTISMALGEPRPSPMTLNHAVERAGFTLVSITPE